MIIKTGFTRQSTIKIASKGSPRNMSSAYNYTYNIHLDNKSGRSLQTIAKEANSFRGVNDYDLFAQYYGDYDYADRWVMAAADGGATNFKSGYVFFFEIQKVIVFDRQQQQPKKHS